MEEDCKAIIFQLDIQTIVDIIVELGLRPKAVCEYLGFCPSLESEEVNYKWIVKSISVDIFLMGVQILCVVCLKMVKYIDNS